MSEQTEHERTLNEILEAAERRVLPPSRHAGQMKANNMVIINIGEDRVIRVTVDNRRILHIKMQDDCQVAVLSLPPDSATVVPWPKEVGLKDFDT
jgi:hypothetical protein